MNKDNAHLYLPLVKALAEGKVIQYQTSIGTWLDVTDVSFGVGHYHYRVKPEPRVRWAVYDENGEFRVGSHDKKLIEGMQRPKDTMAKFVEELEG